MVGELQVLVLAGGHSPERDVSLESGRCVADALRGVGCGVELLDPADGEIGRLSAGRWDVAFPVVHGSGGEDGVLQRTLQRYGIPYVGSSPAASELTFDKRRTRDLLQSRGIRLPEGFLVSAGQPRNLIRTLIVEFGFPVVVKPTCQGSSVGVTIVRDIRHLDAALDEALGFGPQCLVEQYVAGREVTVAFVDGEVFPAMEIIVAEQWYDYQAKYTDDRTEYRAAPDDLPSDLNTITDAACRFCGVEGIARVDFRVDDDGVAWLLEINTVPGMTSHSLVPKSAAAHGLTLGQLCVRSIRHRLAARS